MSRYTHQRSYRTMIDVVGPRRSGNRPRRRRWVKRLMLLGVIYWVGTGLFGSDEDSVTNEERALSEPNDAMAPRTLGLPNYLLAEMTPWKLESVLKERVVLSTPVTTKPEAANPAQAPVARKLSAPKFPHRDPELSLKLQRLLEDYRVPEGAVVVLDTQSGEVVGLAGVRNSRKDLSVAFEAKWPAASLFKTVTASALLKAGKNPSKGCYDVGYRRINKRDLRKSSGRTCADLTLAYGRSYNIHFGQWAKRWLNTESLEAEARNLGFGAKSWVPGHRAGPIDLPEATVDFANTAAGFGDAPMSPYQAALISSAIGNGGKVKVRDHTSGALKESRRLFSTSVAGKLQTAMKATVARGSARKAFRAHGKPALGSGGAAGKTGSLMADGHDLTWFSGFAPANEPRYSVAVMIANDPTWHVKAPYVAREALRSALFDHTPYRPTHLIASR